MPCCIAAAAAVTAKPAKGGAGGAKGGAKPAADTRVPEDISRLDLRVGKIVKVWNHPKADKLYCEEVRKQFSTRAYRRGGVDSVFPAVWFISPYCVFATCGCTVHLDGWVGFAALVFLNEWTHHSLLFFSCSHESDRCG